MRGTSSIGRSTRAGIVAGVVAGVAIAGFLLLDPLRLHGLDERLRGETTTTSGPATGADQGQGLWTCGMHPNVIASEPGICPICQMDLVPLSHQGQGAADPGATAWSCPTHDVIVETEPGECPICGRELVPEGGHDKDAAELPEVVLEESVIQKMNVRTGSVERRDLERRIATVGSLDYNQERMVSVTTRFDGFVERVWVNHVGQPVRRGMPLFEIYSPELVQTQRELLAAVRYAERLTDAGADVRRRAEALADAARTRLDYWGIPPEQVAEVESTGEIRRTLTIDAPADGVVMQRMHGLDGMAVKPGVELLHIADIASLWLRAEIYENQLPWVEVGTRAEVSFDYLPGESFTGRVRYIEPEVSPETRTVALTLEVPNPSGRLRVGMFARVGFTAVRVPDALVVPSQAVIRSGSRNIAVEALTGGRFVPREVVLGIESDAWVEVVDGLSEGDRIVVSAQFLIDSESNLRAAINSLLADRAGHSH